MKRRRIILLGLSLILIFVLWIVLGDPHLSRDEARYQKWMNGPSLYDGIVRLQRHLSPRTSRLLGLPTLKGWALERHDKLGRTLYAAGYITNLTIPMTNAADRSAEIGMNLLQLSVRDGILWQYSLRSHQIILTCRTKDIPKMLHSLDQILAEQKPPNVEDPVGSGAPP